MSVGKQSVQTWNSVTCPAGVMRPTFFPTAFGLLMKDSVNQKLPSLARAMCSGLLPTVGTLNCFSLSGGAAEADVANVIATAVATTIDSRVRARRVMLTPESGRPQLAAGPCEVRRIVRLRPDLVPAL